MAKYNNLDKLLNKINEPLLYLELKLSSIFNLPIKK